MTTTPTTISGNVYFQGTQHDPCENCGRTEMLDDSLLIPLANGKVYRVTVGLCRLCFHEIQYAFYAAKSKAHGRLPTRKNGC